MSEACTLITGATSALGRSMVKKLAGSHRLLLSGRSLEKLEAVRMVSQRPDHHLSWVQDLVQAGAIAEGLGSILRSNEIAVEHFLHCADAAEILSVGALETAGVSRLFTVNLFSAVEIIRVLASRRTNCGMLRSIIFISSIATRVGLPGYSAYAASKGALQALSRSLAVELAPAVRVNAVLSGNLQSEGARQLFATTHSIATQKVPCPLGQGHPDDVADAAVFLLSDQARWITGQEFVVDGGRSIL